MFRSNLVFSFLLALALIAAVQAPPPSIESHWNNIQELSLLQMLKSRYPKDKVRYSCMKKIIRQKTTKSDIEIPNFNKSKPPVKLVSEELSPSNPVFEETFVQCKPTFGDSYGIPLAVIVAFIAIAAILNACHFDFKRFNQSKEVHISLEKV
jgi:hypothetical protein